MRVGNFFGHPLNILYGDLFLGCYDDFRLFFPGFLCLVF